MDTLTDLLAFLLVLSGSFLCLDRVCWVIERWGGLLAGRPRRAPGRVRQPPRRTRVGRARRPGERGDLDRAASARPTSARVR